MITDTLPEITYRQDDFGYISYTFTLTEGGSAVLPDWDDNLKIEVYDSLENLRSTFTITSDPPIRKDTDDDGNPYIYVDQINLIDFSEGVTTAKIYAYYGEVPWNEYPIVFKPFGVAIYITEGPSHPLAWVTKLRRWLRDYPELNRIIRAEETSDRMFGEALRAAFDEWNATPPYTGNITPNSYPVGAVPIILQLAACHVLKSVLLLRARNRLSYSDGGFAVDEEGAVLQEERALLDYYLREASMALKAYKQHLNITQGWGSVPSEYSYIAYWNEDYYNNNEGGS